jgi:protein-S-isoprenylcysteine O-methyltransferase Ste14
VNAPRVGARPILRRLFQILLQTTVLFGLSFVGAGTLDWPRAWIFLGVSLAMLFVNGILVLRYNPEIVVERGRMHEGTKGFDWVFAVVFGAALILLQVVAGLDAVRFRWAPLPEWTLWLGVALLALGDIPVCAALCTNPHLETTVRIQQDRRHQVITTGPYRFVRHPMYAGMLLQLPATPLALGSAWALLPAGAALAAMVVRTALEDRMLERELAGYTAYARRTRYRLLPGIW